MNNRKAPRDFWITSKLGTIPLAHSSERSAFAFNESEDKANIIHVREVTNEPSAEEVFERVMEAIHVKGLERNYRGYYEYDTYEAIFKQLRLHLESKRDEIFKTVVR